MRFLFSLVPCVLALGLSLGCAKNVTNEEYTQIKKGMTHAEVLKIVGAQPNQTFTNQGPNRKMCVWDNNDRSSLAVGFKNGVVDSVEMFEPDSKTPWRPR